jgi:hypothetical protein
MAAIVVDHWTFWRPDMNEIKEKLEACPAWKEFGPYIEAEDADYSRGVPTMILDWDGKESGQDTGAIARVVVLASFRNPNEAAKDLAEAWGHPILEAKVGSEGITMRFVAPLNPSLARKLKSGGEIAELSLEPRENPKVWDLPGRKPFK